MKCSFVLPYGPRPHTPNHGHILSPQYLYDIVFLFVPEMMEEPKSSPTVTLA